MFDLIRLVNKSKCSSYKCCDVVINNNSSMVCDRVKRRNTYDHYNRTRLPVQFVGKHAPLWNTDHPAVHGKAVN